MSIVSNLSLEKGREVPVAVKDLFAIVGVERRCGSAALRLDPAAEDSAVVERLRAGGAVIRRALQHAAGMHTSRLPASLSKAGRRLGSAKRAEYSALFEARLRLYQRRFLRPRPHFSAFFKLYIFSFAPFQISVIFQAFAPFFANFCEDLMFYFHLSCN